MTCRRELPAGPRSNGRNAITWEEKFALDLWYVENQTAGLDLKIIWLTIKKVLKREGISAEGHASMPEFAPAPAPAPGALLGRSKGNGNLTIAE